MPEGLAETVNSELEGAEENADVVHEFLEPGEIATVPDLARRIYNSQSDSNTEGWMNDDYHNLASSDDELLHVMAKLEKAVYDSEALHLGRETVKTSAQSGLVRGYAKQQGEKIEGKKYKIDKFGLPAFSLPESLLKALKPTLSMFSYVKQSFNYSLHSLNP